MVHEDMLGILEHAAYFIHTYIYAYESMCEHMPKSMHNPDAFMCDKNLYSNTPLFILTLNMYIYFVNLIYICFKLIFSTFSCILNAC